MFENVDAAIVGVPVVIDSDPVVYVGADVAGAVRDVYTLLNEPTVYVPVFVPLVGKRPIKAPLALAWLYIKSLFSEVRQIGPTLEELPPTVQEFLHIGLKEESNAITYPLSVVTYKFPEISPVIEVNAP